MRLRHCGLQELMNLLRHPAQRLYGKLLRRYPTIWNGNHVAEVRLHDCFLVLVTVAEPFSSVNHHTHLCNSLFFSFNACSRCCTNHLPQECRERLELRALCTG